MSKIIRKKEKKRVDLLNAAYDLFTTIGFNHTTVLNIALKAGVAKGTFYLYFDSKEEIRDTLVVQKSSEILYSAMDALEKNNDKSMSVSDKVIFITDYVLSTLSKNIALLKFISKNLSGGIFSETYIASNDTVINFRSMIIEHLHKDGIMLDNPELLIYTVIELINSTCYNIILNGEPVTFDEYRPYLYKTIRLLVNSSVVND